MKIRTSLPQAISALLLTLSITAGAQEHVDRVYRQRSDAPDASAHALFLSGWSRLLKKTPDDALKAISLFKKALEIDPSYQRAYAALAQAYWDNSRDTQFNEQIGEIQMASAIYGNDVIAWEYLEKVSDESIWQAHALIARMLQRQRRFDEAMREARIAVELGPGDSSAYDALIENLIYADQADEAIGLVEQSISLDPDSPGKKLFLMSLAHFMSGRSTEALYAIESARTRNPRQYRYAELDAAILADLGRLDDAKLAFQEYQARSLNFAWVNWTMFYWPFQDSDNSERLAKNLVRAGLVDSPNHFYAVSRANRLSTKQIKALLANKTMIGFDYGPAGSWEEFQIRRDQNAQIVSQDILTYFRDGTTRIEHDLLCDPWYEFGEYCVAIYHRPNGTPDHKDEYIFFTFEGMFMFSLFDI